MNASSGANSFQLTVEIRLEWRRRILNLAIGKTKEYQATLFSPFAPV
jgi:hypothetical protein